MSPQDVPSEVGRRDFLSYLADKDCSEDELKRYFLFEVDDECREKLRSLTAVKSLFGQLHGRRSRETLVHLVNILCDVVICMPTIGEHLNPDDLQPMPWLCEMSERMCYDILRICAKIAERPKGRDLLVTTQLVRFLIGTLELMPKKYIMESILYLVGKVSQNQHHCVHLVESGILIIFKKVAAKLLIREFRDKTNHRSVDRDPRMWRLRDFMGSLEHVQDWNRVEVLTQILYEYRDFWGSAIEQYKELFRLWNIVMGNLTHVDTLQEYTIKYGFLENVHLCFLYAQDQSVPYLFPALVNVSKKPKIKKHLLRTGIFETIFRRFPADDLLNAMKNYDPRFNISPRLELWFFQGLHLAYNVLQEEEYHAGHEALRILKSAKVLEALDYALVEFAYPELFSNSSREKVLINLKTLLS